jgi:hypothetical protein
MGAWGTGPFDNDRARAWVGELETYESLEEVVEALGRDVDWPDGAKFLEAEEAEIVLAVGELVAASLKRPSPTLPEEAHDWLAGADLDLAYRDLEMVRTLVARVEKSALAERWSGDDETVWRAGVEDLSNRLVPRDPTAH